MGATTFTTIESVARTVQTGLVDLIDPTDEEEPGVDPTVPAET